MASFDGAGAWNKAGISMLRREDAKWGDITMTSHMVNGMLVVINEDLAVDKKKELLEYAPRGWTCDMIKASMDGPYSYCYLPVWIHREPWP